MCSWTGPPGLLFLELELDTCYLGVYALFGWRIQPATTVFFSHAKSAQPPANQPANSIFLSREISQPSSQPASRTRHKPQISAAALPQYNNRGRHRPLSSNRTPLSTPVLTPAPYASLLHAYASATGRPTPSLSSPEAPRRGPRAAGRGGRRGGRWW